MPDSLLTEKFDWKGRVIVSELYKANSVDGLTPIKQIQAVCFTKDNKVVLYEHIDGWLGLPGGHLEGGESLQEALQREVNEEVSAELLDWGILGYERIWPEDDPEKISYFVRCWADVELQQEKLDPAGKALGRVVLKPAEALNGVGYGKKGQVWMKLALQTRLNSDEQLNIDCPDL